MAKRRYHNDDMVGVSKRMIDGDGDMLTNAESSPYNMPKEVKMMDYPKCDYAEYPEYADTYSEKDGEMDKAAREVRSHSRNRY